MMNDDRKKRKSGSAEERKSGKRLKK